MNIVTTSRIAQEKEESEFTLDENPPVAMVVNVW